MMVIGLILVAIGVLALLMKLDIISGSLWGYVWPVILIIVGLNFLLGWRSRRMWMWGRHWGPPDNQDQEKH